MPSTYSHCYKACSHVSMLRRGLGNFLPHKKYAKYRTQIILSSQSIRF